MASSKSKQLANLQAYLGAKLGQHVRAGQHLCVALSGGMDSVALLHATSLVAETLRASSVSAVHIHHGLSPNADRWENFCRRYCQDIGITFQALRVSVVPAGAGIEAAARKARFDALDRIDCDWILLAHHRDDQAETVLLNLLRGTGVHGAAGMNEVRGKFLRPLLNVSRREIELYARRNSLSWIEDESNSDLRFSRNFLRHHVIPQAEKHFPNTSGNLARAGIAFREATELLDEVARNDLEDAVHLNASRLRSLTSSRAANLLAYYLKRQGLQIPGSALLKEMLRQLRTARNASEICFVIGDKEVRCFRDQVMVVTPMQPNVPVSWPGPGTFKWGHNMVTIRMGPGDGISSGTIELDEMEFSVRRPGSTVQLHDGGPHRPLKDLLREAGIPPWLRGTLPVLYSGQEVVWVAGIGSAAKYRCARDAEGFLIEFDGVSW